MMTKDQVIKYLNEQFEKYTTLLRFRAVKDSPFVHVINLDMFLNPCSNMCIVPQAKDLIIEKLVTLGINQDHIQFIRTNQGWGISADKDGRQYWEILE